jgi:hypothetical protein
MPGLQFIGRLRPDEARRFIGRLEWLQRGMITIVTTLEVPPLPGPRRGPPPFGDAPLEWVVDVGCDVRAAHVCTVIDTLPAPDT